MTASRSPSSSPASTGRSPRTTSSTATFHTIANVDWHAHTLDLADFWTAVLLGEPHQHAVETIEAHRWLHDTEPFDDNLFELWVEILDETLDGGWNGPMTESARRRGRGLAWAMAKRLTGHTPRRTA